MSKSSKLILFAAIGLAGFIVLVVTAAVLFSSMNARPQVEAVASQALQMEVNVNGRLTFGFFPGLHLALADVHARKHGGDIASAGEVDLGIELLPLLHKEIRVGKIGLKRLRLTIERGRDGNLNFAQWSPAKGVPATLAVAQVSVSDATLVYADQQSGKGFDATNCNLEVNHLDLLKNLPFAGKLACGQIRTKDFTAFDLRLSIDGKSGVFDFDPVAIQLFGGHGTGNVRADFSGSVPLYHVRYGLTKFRVEEFFKTLSPKDIGQGSMDFAADLSLRGASLDALKRTVAGEASLHGENFQLEIGDLDKKFSRYESSQSFNLVDVGAFFFAGPLGLGVTKGYDFARIFEGSGGSTTIRTLISNWRVEHGVAHATDVAMATQENRAALQGGLDFVNGRFDEVTVALIDAKGCSRVQQKIRGPFLKPQVEKPSALGTLVGPTRRLLRQAKHLFGGQCAVFYTGSVAPPK